MTAVPQRTALSHAFGALAAGLVGTAEYYLERPDIDGTTMLALGLEVVLGFLTFTGSLVAAGKLQGIVATAPGSTGVRTSSTCRPWWPRSAWSASWSPTPGSTCCSRWSSWSRWPSASMLVTRIGGADMPTVISLLNSFAGLSAAMMGFVLGNKLLIVAGALDGSSGLILSIVMCRAMNRSFTNVLFGGFGAETTAGRGRGPPRAHVDAEEAAFLLDAARIGRGRPRLRHGRGPGTAQGPRAHRLRCSIAVST